MFSYAQDDEEETCVAEDVLVCGYCLMEVSADECVICGTCRRRCFCSKQCQLADLSINGGTGQGHRFWCGIRAGEEGIDWMVRESAGKGLGVFALQDIKAGSRIMIDRAYTTINAHSALSQLEPFNGTPRQKFALNAVGGRKVCMRLSRVNHACSPNAQSIFDVQHDCMILYAHTDIDAGDEILISYHTLKDPRTSLTPREIEQKLERVGVVCPRDCDCKNKGIYAVHLRQRQLYDNIHALINNKQYSRAFEICQQAILFTQQIESSLEVIMDMYFLAFSCGIANKQNMGLAIEFMREGCDIQASLVNPAAKAVKENQTLLEHPRKHPNYLVGSLA